MIPHGVANSHIRPAPKTMGMINYKTRLADSFQQLERFSQILPPGKLSTRQLNIVPPILNSENKSQSLTLHPNRILIPTIPRLRILMNRNLESNER